MLRLYYYYHYKIYSSIEYTSKLFGGAFLTDLKTAIVICVFEIWTVVSVFNYYTSFTGNILKLSIDKPLVLIPVLIIVGSKYFLFLDKGKWLPYHREFKLWPSGKNKIGSFLVFIISIFIITNLIWSFYLLSR